MPSIERACFIHKAVLWRFTTYDSHGQPLVTDNPVEIKCKWNDTRSESQDKDGNTITVDATAVVDRRILPGSLLWKGRLSKFPGDTKAPYFYDGRNGPIMVCKSWNGVDDIKGRVAAHSITMLRHSNEITAQTGSV